MGKRRIGTEAKLTALACALMLFCVFLLCPVKALADEQLRIDVTYDQVKCGTPTTFHIEAAGGSGSYKYMLQCVMRYEEEQWTLVTDPSRSSYGPDKDYAFTFYASGRYMVYCYVFDTVNYAYKRQIVDITIDDPAYPAIEDIVEKVAGECQAAGCSTDYEKALWMHDWVLSHCAYDYSYVYCGAEGALARGKGICESYHRAYVMLLSAVGVESGRIEGNGHVWTAVKMNGAWYQVDTTWDDPGYGVVGDDAHYLYFGLNDEITTLVHDEHAVNEGYESSSLEDNYFIKSGKISSRTEKYASLVQDALDQEKTSFELSSQLVGIDASYHVVFNSLVAFDLSRKAWTTADGRRAVVSAFYEARSLASDSKMIVQVTYYDASTCLFEGHGWSGAACLACGCLRGDVNGNGALNIVDAQIAYDMGAKGMYQDNPYYQAMRACADVNQTDTAIHVDAIDAWAIQRAVHLGWSVK